MDNETGAPAPETGTEEGVEQQQGETVEELKAKLEAKSKAFEDQRLRAEKAEKKLKESPARTSGDQKSNDLSTRDLFELTKAGINDLDDVDFLQRAAAISGKSLGDTVRDKSIMAILNSQREERITAEATSTGSNRKITPRATDEQLVQRASKGEIPESEEEITRLIRAKFGIKR
jgi:hypothetical protein